MFLRVFKVLIILITLLNHTERVHTQRRQKNMSCQHSFHWEIWRKIIERKRCTSSYHVGIENFLYVFSIWSWRYLNDWFLRFNDRILSTELIWWVRNLLVLVSVGLLLLVISVDRVALINVPDL